MTWLDPTEHLASRSPAALANQLLLRGLGDAGRGFPAPSTDPAHALEWRRIPGLAAPPGVVATTLPASLCTRGAAHASLGFLVTCSERRVTVAVGLDPARATPLFRALGGTLGMPVGDHVTPALPSQSLPKRVFVGIPHPEWPALDLALDAAGDGGFTLLVLARALPPDAALPALGRVRAAAGTLDRTALQGDRDAAHAASVLSAWEERLATFVGQGGWTATATLVAADRDRLDALAALLLGGAAPGMPTQPEPRWLPTVAGPGPGNLLLDGELARLLRLPTRDRTGFERREATTWSPSAGAASPGPALGQVVIQGEVSPIPLPLGPGRLARHLLVAGETGSGKSTTIRRILSTVAAEGRPFLLLDPAKPLAEHAALAQAAPGLVALTVGRPPGLPVPRGMEAVPLALNPCRFPEGFPVLTHIALLGETLTAAFGLESPAPQVLELALLRAYEAAGWDVVTGAAGPTFPLLSEVADAVDEVIDEAAYSGEVTRNLKGALGVRLRSLTRGARGAALEVRVETPEAWLFGRPAVLELVWAGSEEHQAFWLGSVLTRLVERRLVEGLASAGELRHLCVVEEAHRLLRPARPRGPGSPDASGQGVRTLGGMLAEMRAYGQGIGFVDQLPGRLDETCVSLVATRIVHRLTPRRDREELGGAMALDDAQIRALARLPTGQAVVQGEGTQGAVVVQVAPQPVDVPLHPWPYPALGALRQDQLKAPQRARCRDQGLVAWADAAVLAAILGQGDAPCARLRLEARDDALATVCLEEALLRRARTLRIPSLADRAPALLAGSDSAAAAVRAARAGAPTSRPWCARCPSPCLFGAEAFVVARDRRVALAASEFLDGRPRARLIGAVTEALARHLPGIVAPSALVACAAAEATRRADAGPAVAEATFATALHPPTP